MLFRALARVGHRPPLLLVAVLWLAVLPAVADGASAPRVVATSHVPLVAAAGDRIAVTAKVAGTGKRVVLGLVLGSPHGSATGGLALGKGVKFSRRGTRRVVVGGRVPATVALGELHTLLVCVNPAGATRGKGACRKAARIATSGTSTQERLAGAQQAGRLSRARGVLLGLLRLRGGTRVPSELRGDLDGPGGEQAAVKTAASSFGSLPLAVKRQVLPYFVPPPVRGSAWQANGRPRRAGKARAATAAPANCQGYDSIKRGVSQGNGLADPWSGIPTSDGKAIVWYETARDESPRLQHYEAVDRASANNYARVLPAIWTKLTKEFGQPQSDAKEACYHGPDGRLDVYVSDDLVSINTRSLSKLAITEPYATAGKFCTDRPAFILARPGLAPFAMAHEFMHVLQFSHRYVTCDEPISWWDEGGAHWAGDYVYPDDNFERQFPRLIADPLHANLVNLDYDAWPFWMMLQRTLGTDVLRSIFTQLRSQRSVQAVNAAIPGGFAMQLPRFFLHAFNQSPIGDAGFAIPESFLAWDKWNQTPNLPASSTLNLGTLPADTLPLPSQRADGFPALSVGAYHRVDIPDPAVREIKFTNDLAGKPGAHVDALLHMADGSWKLADWTANRTVTLCRDKASENVLGLVIVSTNTGTSPLGAFTHTLKAGSTCPFPQRFDGTWTRVYTDPSQGSWTETIHGTATYVRNPSFPPEADTQSQVLYDVQTSTVTWTVSGSQDPGTGCLNNFSGSGTDTPTTNHTGTNTDLGLENVSHHQGAPDPEPKPYYYSIRAGIDPSTGPQYDVTDCHGNDSKELVVLPYLEIGHPGPFMPDTPPEEIIKSDDARLLEGHRSVTDPSSGDLIDDTWSFKGSD